MSELVAQVVWQRPPAGTLQRGWLAVPAPWLRGRLHPATRAWFDARVAALRGVLASVDVAYFVLLAAFCLVLAARFVARTREDG